MCASTQMSVEKFIFPLQSSVLEGARALKNPKHSEIELLTLSDFSINSQKVLNILQVKQEMHPECIFPDSQRFMQN